MSLKSVQVIKIRITIIWCKDRDWVPTRWNRDQTTFGSFFLCQKEFLLYKIGVSNILRAWEMSLKSVQVIKIWITIFRCKDRDWVPTGWNRDQTTFGSIFLCQKEFLLDRIGISNILRAWEMCLKSVQVIKIRITIFRCNDRYWVPTGWNRDQTTFGSIFLCQKEFFLDKIGISNILRAWEMRLKSVQVIKIRITIFRCKDRDWVPTRWNRDQTTFGSIFLCQKEFSLDKIGVYNILRVWEMSLKSVQVTKIRITIFRCKDRDWVPTRWNHYLTTFGSIFLCQKEFSRDKIGISNILRAWEMSLKSVQDIKIRISIFLCKDRDWVPTVWNHNQTSFGSIFLCQRNFFWTKLAFLIF
jgi:hypothetical protein